MKNYYRILNIRSNATADEIKASYRKLAKQYHPDTHPGDKAAANTFADINEAYTVLSDKEKRAAYDAQLQQESIPRRSATRPLTPEELALKQLEVQAQMEIQKAVQAGVQAQLTAVRDRAYRDGYARGNKDGQEAVAKQLHEERKKYKQKLAESSNNTVELEQELFDRDRELAKANDTVRELRAQLNTLRKAMPDIALDPVVATIDDTKFRTKELENAIADIHIPPTRIKSTATAALNDKYSQIKRNLAMLNGTLNELNEQAEHLRAQNNLHIRIDENVSSPEEKTAQTLWKHFGELLSLALAGEADAQNALGELYYRGDKIERDFSQAVYWFREAVAQQHPAAIGNLGKCYLNGEGVRRNKSIGLAYMRQAQNLGVLPPDSPDNKQ